MNRKNLIIFVLAVSMLQAPKAQAGLFDSLGAKIAAIGLLFAGLFKITSASRGSNQSSGADGSVLASDPNEYSRGRDLDDEPLRAECIPRTTSHRCSYLESDVVVANTCVNPVNVANNGMGNSNGVSTGQ